MNRSTNKRRSRRRHRSADVTIKSIAHDALSGLVGGSIVSVGPAAEGDPTLLFLQHDGATRFLLGVPPSVIRSPRLRGTRPGVDRQAEQEFELLRVHDAVTADPYETCGVDRDDDLGR